MVKTHCRALKQRCLKLSVAAFCILVANTALGNNVSAAEVFSTSLSTLNQGSGFNLQEMTSGFVSKAVTFVKESLETSTSQNKFDFFADTANKKNQGSDLIDNGLEAIFEDLESNPNRYFAETLASNGIITKSKKFYPSNYIRLNEVAKMFVNSYRYKVGYELSTDAGLTDKSHFDKMLPKYYNTAYEMGLLNGVENIEDFERFITYYDLEKILKNFDNQYPNLVNLYYFDVTESNANLKRDDVARVVFKTIMLDSDTNYYFDDVVYHENRIAIEKLADLGLLDTGVTMYNPDDPVTRNDFIVLIVKILLTTKDEHLDPARFRGRIKDLDYNSSLAEYIGYAEDQGFLDYLIETVRGEEYFHPDKSLTKHEAYYIISKVFGKEFDYDIISADKETITRGEIAELLVDNINLGKSRYDVSKSHIGKIINGIKSIVQLAQGGQKSSVS